VDLLGSGTLGSGAERLAVGMCVCGFALPFSTDLAARSFLRPVLESEVFSLLHLCTDRQRRDFERLMIR